MQRLVRAIALSCVLSTVVVAGEIPTVGVKTAEPGVTVCTLPGEIPTVGCSQPGVLTLAAATANEILAVALSVF